MVCVLIIIFISSDKKTISNIIQIISDYKNLYTYVFVCNNPRPFVYGVVAAFIQTAS